MHLLPTTTIDELAKCLISHTLHRLAHEAELHHLTRDDNQALRRRITAILAATNLDRVLRQ